MKKEDIPPLREKLTKECDKKIAQGWNMMAGVTLYRGDQHVWCCPIGAATEEEDLGVAADLLNISNVDAERFADGFDGGNGKSMMAELGREFRKKYLK